MAARTAHPPPPADTPVADTPVVGTPVVGTPVVGTPVADVATLSFEEALAELERIVRALEGGQQKLEDAIGAYERGAKLKAHCEAKLAEAEQRVQAIVAGADGSLSLRSAE